MQCRGCRVSSALTPNHAQGSEATQTAGRPSAVPLALRTESGSSIASSRCELKEMVSLITENWNQLVECLKRLESLREYVQSPSSQPTIHGAKLYFTASNVRHREEPPVRNVAGLSMGCWYEALW